MKNRNLAKQEILKLVKRFEQVSHAKEANTDTKWIKPLMTALGWEMTSDDVIEQEQVGVTFPDYTFKIKGHRKFILEAKGVGISLDGKYANKTFVEQALDYAKHLDCTWAILTNFEEFRVYSTDRSEIVFQVSFREFGNESGFDRLWYFSKDSMAKGELDTFGEQWGFKKKKIAIDKILLNDLIHFREILSKDLIKNNERFKYEIDLCDEIVQKILDRFIFIRNCEDIGIEADKLISLVGAKNIIRKLRELFRDTDKYGYYNSSLFSKHECDRPDIIISDVVLAEIIAGLYQSRENNVRYQFSEIESDVLGNIYEQYLSHLLKKRKKGSLDESFAKKKQQGIYYTPTYVVDYIVRQALGSALEGKNKSQLEKITVLDMACGSGSFLIKCYDVLENAYLGNITIPIETKQSKLQLSLNVTVDIKKSLSPIKKCEIIERNIYGVDLDKQAVEISQLNLMLKIKQKVKLPFTNITCGDSLIDENNSDYGIGLFENFTYLKKQEFDVIIGNPPYVDIKELDNRIVKKLFAVYSTVENRMNLYSVFVERALQRLKNGGYFGFIIPNSILYNESYDKIRRMLLNNVCFKEIVRLPDNVFEGVKVETVILIFKKDKTNISNNSCKVLVYKADDEITYIGEENCGKVAKFRQSDWQKEGIINLTLEKGTKAILKKIESKNLALKYYCDFSLGLTPYDKYKGHKPDEIENRIFHADKPKTKFHKPLLNGEDITRYGINWKGDSYIKYGDWLGAPREQRFFVKPRIIVRQIISGNPMRIYAAYSDKEYYNAQIGFNILVKHAYSKDINVKYLLGLMNSNLMSYYHREKYLDTSKKLFQKILIANAKKFPVSIASKAAQNRIEHLVDTMIALKHRLYMLGDEQSERKRKIEKQIEIIDKRINVEVYKIYSLSKNDIDSIENALLPTKNR